MIDYRRALTLSFVLGFLGCVGGKGGLTEGGAEVGGAEVGGAEAGGAETGGAEAGGAEAGGAEAGGAEVGGGAGSSAGDCSELILELGSENLSGEVTWSCGVYRVDRRLTIEDGTLTLGPCTTLEMGSGARIEVQFGGQLVAAGSEACPVVLTSQIVNPLPGAWGGLRVYEGGRANLEHSVIEYGGGSTAVSGLIEVNEGGELSLERSTLRGSSTGGLTLKQGAQISALDELVITENTEAPIAIDPNLVSSIASVELTGNTLDQIKVSGFNSSTAVLSQSSTWRDHGVPYRLYTDLEIETNLDQAVLTLSEGVRLEMNPERYIAVQDNGGLVVSGSATRPVTITSSKGEGATRGDWEYITFKSGSLGNVNRIEHAVIEYGGAGYWPGVVRVEEEAQLSLQSSTIRGSSTWGLVVEGALSTCTQNQLIDHVRGGALVTPSQVGQLGEGVYGPNDAEGIFIEGGEITTAVRVIDQGVPYVLTDDLDVNGAIGAASFTLEEGVELRLNAGVDIETGSGGQVLLEGSEARRVKVTANQPDPSPGFWGRVKLRDSGDLTWRYADLEFGGEYWGESVLVSGGSLTLSSVSISNSLNECAIETERSGVVTADASSSVNLCP